MRRFLTTLVLSSAFGCSVGVHDDIAFESPTLDATAGSTSSAEAASGSTGDEAPPSDGSGGGGTSGAPSATSGTTGDVEGSSDTTGEEPCEPPTVEDPDPPIGCNTAPTLCLNHVCWTGSLTAAWAAVMQEYACCADAECADEFDRAQCYAECYGQLNAETIPDKFDNCVPPSDNCALECE